MAVTQIIPTRRRFDALLFIFCIFVYMVCDFVFDSIWNLDLVWLLPGTRSCRVRAGFDFGKEEIPGDLGAYYVFGSSLDLC